MTGQTLGHYKILDKLGAGGMGEVYRAEDTTLDREVALKILPPDLAESQERLDRFQREAKTLAALDHPNIVHIHTVEEVGGVHFLTMQLVEGKPLSQLIPKGGMPLERIFEIAIPLADALATAHEKGVIHRDLKPANIMVTDEGRVKVLDFGLAKLRQEAEIPLATELPTEPLTEQGKIVGTMPYMSPEQLEGKEIDDRSDIFSLGVTLYEMATSQRPFSGDTSVSLISSIVKDTPVAVDTLREGLPHHLARVIAHCLEKNPKHRYQSVIDVHNELVALKREIESGVVQPSSEEREIITEPQSRRRWAVAGGIAFLAAVVVITVLWFALSRRPTAEGRGISSLAVLPLRNLSGDPAQEYFSQGMTEALITDLSKISALKVISHTSVLRFKETEEPIPEIAEELGVDAIIEGSVLLAGDQVRITAQLIDGKTDEHLWADNYTRELENVLTLHSEVARAIAEEIEVAVTADEASRLADAPRIDPEALQAFLKGQYYWNKRTTEGLTQALKCFREATEIEPEWAIAHAGLAKTYVLLPSWDVMDPDRSFPAAERSALRAIEIDDSSSEARTALGWIRVAYDWDWSDAERMFQRAIELNPSNATAHQWYAELFTVTGRQEEALQEITLAKELDPLSLIISSVEGWVLYSLRQYDRAVEVLEEVLAADANFPKAHSYLGRTYLALGMHEEAAAEFEKSVALSGGDLSERVRLASCYAAMGRKEDAIELTRELEARESPPALHMAKLSLALGRRDEALTWLETGFAERDVGMYALDARPGFDSLRDEPRFIALLQRMNSPG